MRSTLTGPVIVSGNLNPAQLQDPDVGPSLVFQGQGLIDPRQVSTIDSAPGSLIYGFYNSEMVSLLDNTPSASAAANIYTIGSGQVVPAGGTLAPAPITASAASAAVSPNVPVTVFGNARNAANVLTAPMTIDFGFSRNVTTAATSATITLNAVGDVKYYYKGQWLCIPGAGTSTTQPLIAQVVSINATAGTVLLSAAAGQTIAGTAAVGSLDPGGFAAWPWIKAGCTALMDPTQTFARAIRVVNNSISDTGYAVVLRGYDIYGVPMTESIPVTANSTAYGKKAWKHIFSWSLTKTGGGTTVGTITLGTSDVYGLPLRSDFFEYISEYYAGAFIATNGSSNPLWVAADTTNPQTPTNGDSRGTIQVGAAGGGASTAAAPNGTNRLAVFMSVPAYNAVNSNNLNFASLLGFTQNNS
jgi:hypothetical protein